MKKKVIILVFALTCLLSLNVFALNGLVEGEKVSDAKYMADTLWVLVAAFLVFFMQAGFAMVESGFTRAKNAVNILMKNLMDFSMGSIAYWAIGFAIMFGAGNAFMGTSGWFVPSDSGVFGSLEWSSVPTQRRMALPVGVRCDCCNYRFWRNGRTHTIQELSDLQRLHHGYYLSRLLDTGFGVAVGCQISVWVCQILRVQRSSIQPGVGWR